MIKKKYLLTPGPTPVPEKVLAAASLPLIHHRTPEFRAILHEVSEGLKYVFQTRHPVYTLAASGSGAMEAAVVNTVSPGERVLVVNAGKFSERWAQIARAHGIQVVEEQVAWGDDYSPEQLRAALKKNPDVQAVFTTLSETSSGAFYDVRGYAQVTRETPALLVVDGISGLGALPCPMDEWQIDVLIGASQKSLMTPPGLSYISLSPNAWKKVEKGSSGRYYFDLKKYRQSLDKETTPFTPAITLVRQQQEALKLIREIKLEELHQHHRILADAVRAAARALGLELLAKKPGNVLTAIKVPAGLNGQTLVQLLQSKYLTHVASAQEPHQGEFFRIAHLGYMDGVEMLAVIAALEMALQELRFKFPAGQGLLATEKVLQENWT